MSCISCASEHEAQICQQDGCRCGCHAAQTADTAALARELRKVQGFLKRECRGHNSRGEDGPCWCESCTYLEKVAIAKAEALAQRVGEQRGHVGDDGDKPS